MKQSLTLVAAGAAMLLTAGCGSSGSTGTSVDRGANADDGLSGTQSEFNSMTNPCIAQASRMTGLGRGAIVVTDRIRTGGGPLLTLDAGGTRYSCRREGDGSVTVFSEFAD
jgi:hypothetical protein